MAEILAQAPSDPRRHGLAPETADEGRFLTSLIERIRAFCSPSQVYLFGSRAHGTARNASDVDLLVVLPDEEATMDRWAALLDATARGPVGVDVAISTPEEFAWRSQVPGFVENDACQRGRLLYG